MAVTKIWAITKTLDKALKYILNPVKSMYTHSYACTPETADLEFELTLEANIRSGGKNKAFHFIQSFEPEETTPELAHEIGKQLAESHLGNQYEYVLTTHIDKGHIHNHVIFCASSFVTHQKYNDCKKSYYQLRQTSDELCAGHGLSVLPLNQNHGKSHYEWQMDQQGVSWKSQLRKNIDAGIRTSTSFEDLLTYMQQLGYEVKQGKHLAFRASGQERFTRIKQLGEDYTEEKLKERINKKTKKLITPKKFRPDKQELSLMIKLEENQKVLESKSYERWAKLFNLKQSAKTLKQLAEHGSWEGLQTKKTHNQEEQLKIQTKLHLLESKLADKKAQVKQLEQETSTPSITQQLKKNKLIQEMNPIQEEIKALRLHNKKLKQDQKEYSIIEQNIDQTLTPKKKPQDKER